VNSTERERVSAGVRAFDQACPSWRTRIQKDRLLECSNIFPELLRQIFGSRQNALAELCSASGEGIGKKETLRLLGLHPHEGHEPKRSEESLRLRNLWLVHIDAK